MACGCQPCGTSLLCHTFLGVQGTRGGKKKRPLQVRTSCALLEQSLVSHRLGRTSSQHGTPGWPSPEPTLGLQQRVKSFSREQNSFVSWGGRRKYCWWIELAYLMACIGLSPPSAQEKDFPAVCTAVASECVCPHVQKQAVFLFHPVLCR